MIVLLLFLQELKPINEYYNSSECQPIPARIELANSLIQLEIYQRTAIDSKQLLDAERNMFENGESSLFLINMRELNYIQSQLKYLEWQAKNKQLGYSLGFAKATLF